MRVLVHAVGEQAALVEADIAGRRADEPRNGVPLHIFRHVEAEDLHAEQACELAGDLRLADAGRAGEEIAADGLLGIAKPGAGELDGRRQRMDGLVLAEHDALEIVLKVAQQLGIGLRTVFGGMRAMVATVASTSFTPMVRLRFDGGSSIARRRSRRSRRWPCRAAAVVDVLRRKLDRGLDGLVGVLDAVDVLEVAA